MEPTNGKHRSRTLVCWLKLRLAGRPDIVLPLFRRHGRKPGFQIAARSCSSILGIRQGTYEAPPALTKSACRLVTRGALFERRSSCLSDRGDVDENFAGSDMSARCLRRRNPQAPRIGTRPTVIAKTTVSRCRRIDAEHRPKLRSPVTPTLKKAGDARREHGETIARRRRPHRKRCRIISRRRCPSQGMQN